MLGITLAAFGLIMALMQATMVGPTVKRIGEWNAALVGMAAAGLGALLFGLAPSLLWVLLILFIHAPESFVHPMLTAIMSKEVPDDAQGELQGGISSIMNIAMMLGTVFYSQAFGYFLQPNPYLVSSSATFFIAFGLVGFTLLYLLSAKASQRHLISKF